MVRPFEMPSQSYCLTIVQFLASRNSNSPSLRFFVTIWKFKNDFIKIFAPFCQSCWSKLIPTFDVFMSYTNEPPKQKYSVASNTKKGKAQPDSCQNPSKLLFLTRKASFFSYEKNLELRILEPKDNWSAV